MKTKRPSPSLRLHHDRLRMDSAERNLKKIMEQVNRFSPERKPVALQEPQVWRSERITLADDGQ